MRGRRLLRVALRRGRWRVALLGMGMAVARVGWRCGPVGPLLRWVGLVGRRVLGLLARPFDRAGGDRAEGEGGAHPEGPDPQTPGYRSHEGIMA
jgi:hypothetical protein